MWGLKQKEGEYKKFDLLLISNNRWLFCWEKGGRVCRKLKHKEPRNKGLLLLKKEFGG